MSINYNNFKSTTIRGSFQNLDYPDNSAVASALFARGVIVNETITTNALNSTNDITVNGVGLGVGKTSGLANNISIGGGLSNNLTGAQNISIGVNSHFACGNPQRNTAIGCYSMANSNNTFRCSVLGYGANSLNNYGVSIGYGAVCGISGLNGVAIGANSNALYSNSVAIGYGVSTTIAGEIMLGSSTQFVTIPNILQLNSIPNVYNYLTSLSGNFTNYLTTTLASSTYQTQTSATSNFNTLSSLIYSNDTVYFNYFNTLSSTIYTNYNTLSSLIYSISGTANNQTNFNTLSALIYSVSGNLNSYITSSSGLINSISGYAYSLSGRIFSLSGSFNSYLTSSSGLINSISGNLYNNYVLKTGTANNALLVYNNIDNSSATNYCLLFAPQLSAVQNNTVYQTGTAGTNILYYTPSTNTINATCALSASSTNSQNALNVNIAAAPNSSIASQSILFINNTSGSGTGNFPCHTTNLLQYVSSTGTLSTSILSLSTSLIAGSITLSTTILGYLSGLTSNVQTQINSIPSSSSLLSTANTWTGQQTFNATITTVQNLAASTITEGGTGLPSKYSQLSVSNTYGTGTTNAFQALTATTFMGKTASFFDPTSSIQTQLNGLQPTLTTASNISVNNVTVNGSLTIGSTGNSTFGSTGTITYVDMNCTINFHSPITNDLGLNPFFASYITTINANPYYIGYQKTTTLTITGGTASNTILFGTGATTYNTASLFGIYSINVYFKVGITSTTASDFGSAAICSSAFGSTGTTGSIYSCCGYNNNMMSVNNATWFNMHYIYQYYTNTPLYLGIFFNHFNSCSAQYIITRIA